MWLQNFQSWPVYTTQFLAHKSDEPSMLTFLKGSILASLWLDLPTGPPDPSIHLPRAPQKTDFYGLPLDSQWVWPMVDTSWLLEGEWGQGVQSSGSVTAGMSLAGCAPLQMKAALPWAPEWRGWLLPPHQPLWVRDTPSGYPPPLESWLKFSPTCLIWGCYLFPATIHFPSLTLLTKCTEENIFF